MSKFRKKPVVIEAYQWLGPIRDAEYLVAFDDWMVAHRDRTTKCPRYVGNRIRIHTLEGEMMADPGDWIICGVKGEIYACKPDIFALTYEPVDTTA